MESVCSQVVPGSGSSCKWESVGIENESVTDVLKLRRVLTKSSKWLRRLVATRGGTLSFVDKLQKYMYIVEAHMNIVPWLQVGDCWVWSQDQLGWADKTPCTQLKCRWTLFHDFKWEIVGYEARTNWVGLSRHHVLVSGLNHCVYLLSLFIYI